MDYFGQIINRYPGENLFWVHASPPVKGAVNMGRYVTRDQLERDHEPVVAAVCCAFGDADELKRHNQVR